MTELKSAKAWLRAFARHQRNSISNSARQRFSQEAVQNLVRQVEYKRAQVIAIYLSFGSELETRGLIERAWNDRKTILIPNTSRGLHRPFFNEYKPGDVLQKTKFGPLEHKAPSKAFDMKKIDLVIVPGLAFDSRGHRLGYGGGTYDRILMKTAKKAHVGLFFSGQQLPLLPLDRNDRPLALVSTEKGVISCLAKS